MVKRLVRSNPHGCSTAGGRGRTTRDIADNVGQASQGVQEVNENVSQAEAVTRDIAKEVASVNEAPERSRIRPKRSRPVPKASAAWRAT